MKFIHIAALILFIPCITQGSTVKMFYISSSSKGSYVAQGSGMIVDNDINPRRIYSGTNSVGFDFSYSEPSYSYTRDLTIGSYGADVEALQTELETRGHLLIPSGKTKGYFGSMTQSALASYQSSIGISPASGYFGPLTRSVFNGYTTEKKRSSISFTGPNDSLLTPGAIYVATRFPFQEDGRAGFSWSYSSRALNTSTTVFTVLEVEYDSETNLPTKLAIDFTQFEDTWGDLDPSSDDYKWSFGSFRYNSDIPVSVIPEPSSITLFGISSYFLMFFRGHSRD